MAQTTLSPDVTALPPDQRDRLFRQRLHRYVTAMNNAKPDRVPIRPFLAECTGAFGGYDCQQLTHDFENAFAAVRATATQLDCDALVANMVYCWSGFTQAMGLRYYGIPGSGQGADKAFQYLEPPTPEDAYMRHEEYDHFIEDPTGFLYEVWLPRVSNDVNSKGEPCSYRNQLALVKGGMAMWHYFMGFGRQAAAMKDEVAMPGAISGLLKAPMDILADKFRGYMGLLDDLENRPDKVIAACHALTPHMLHVAMALADPTRHVPVAHWMHRSCVPLITPEHFNTIHWPTLKPILEHLWKAGHQTLLYAEGDWTHHLDAFRELPPRSIVYHVDRGDIVETHRRLGDRFCVSGGVGNAMLAYGTPEQVRNRVREVIDACAADGGFILDAEAIVQNDAKVENVRAMVEAGREFGDYGGTPCDDAPELPTPDPGFEPTPVDGWTTDRAPGVCIPWSDKVGEMPEIQGDPDLFKRVWENVDGFGYTFIWHCVVSF